MAAIPLLTDSGPAVATPTVAPSAPERACIQYGGRRFTCSPEMARIFLRHARVVIESGEDELVPLHHADGIELLLISRAMPYTLLDLPDAD